MLIRFYIKRNVYVSFASEKAKLDFDIFNNLTRGNFSFRNEIRRKFLGIGVKTPP
jgi:hypothetical protein